MGCRAVVVVLFAVCWSFSGASGAEKCRVEPDVPCRCSTNNISININTFFPKYPITTHDGVDLYTYSPCTPIKLNPSSNQTALVWQTTGKVKYNALGRGNNILWEIISTQPLKFEVMYYGGDPMGETNRSAKFFFSYSKTSTRWEFVQKDQHTKEFMFKVDGNTVLVTSHHDQQTKASIPVGIIGLVIITLCLVSLISYCATGMVYKYRTKQARGCDVIPNADFWRDIPFLVKEGSLFTASLCTQRCNTYQKL